MLDTRAAEPRAVTLRRAPHAVPAAAAVALTLLLGSLAVARNHAVVGDFSWPALDTQYRELAAAQTILDDRYGPDSTYRGERVWYNPMAPWIVAGLARVSDVPAPAVVARAGPWLNLLAPMAFFTMVALLFDVYAALGATAAFIFITGTAFPFYYAATYSPWFGPENFGQAFLYCALIVAVAAFDRPFAVPRAALLGILLGVTFLTHTAPALVLGCCMVALAAWQWRSSRSISAPFATLATALTVAFVVALPFGIEILWHYRLKIVNAYPGMSPSDLLDLNELPQVARAAVSVPVVAGALALAYRALRDRRGMGTRLSIAWGGVCVVFLGAHILALLAEKAGMRMPSVVPAFHFFYYLMALLSVGVGLAVRDLSAAGVRWMDRRQPTPSEGTPDWRVTACAGLATFALVAAYYPQYSRRPDFTELREHAAMMNREVPADAYAWIRAHTRPDDVFLCTDDQSLYVVAPAGRKVVATNRYFSSPYVDWASRDHDRAEMFARLEARDVAGFGRVSERYGVRYVIVAERPPTADWLKASGLYPRDIPSIRAGDLLSLPGFELAFRGSSVAIFAVPDRRS
jgi:hypothetical protein